MPERSLNGDDVSTEESVVTFEPVEKPIEDNKNLRNLDSVGKEVANIRSSYSKDVILQKFSLCKNRNILH